MNGYIVYSPDANAPFSLKGTNATHICDPGFVLNGTVIRTCQNDSSFDNAPPLCQRKSVEYYFLRFIVILQFEFTAALDCGTPNETNNGTISWSTTVFNSTATYSCHKGFSIVGNMTIFCQDNGNWSESPVCLGR